MRKNKERRELNRILRCTIVLLNGLSERCAKWANLKTAHIGINTWRYLLIVFCVISVIASIMSICSSRSGQLTFTKPTAPAYLGKSGTAHQEHVISVIPPSLKTFRKQLDSMQATAPGKKYYDSLLQIRPGLLDSLYLVEQVYRTPF